MLSSLNPLPHLSQYRGPYKVGSTEYEIPVSEIGSSSVIPDPRVTTIKFRIFYPTTSSATSKKSITWLPSPQKLWNQAYAQFMGISEKKASWLSRLPSLLSYVTIPAIQNAPLVKEPDSKPLPVVIFSHGLGGNYNTYSSLLGSLASCGVVCIAPEHRDGSSPTALIKSSRDKIETQIPYVKLSHSPTIEVLNARNAMLRTRTWELELTYSAISQINQGKHFTNFADSIPQDNKAPLFHNSLDFRSSKVTWAGHSFGSATTLQFVKSVYYHQQAPKSIQKSSNNDGWNMTPLYTPDPSSELVKQIKPESPIILLDLWTMPLRGAATQWLFDRHLPCYDQKSISRSPNVIAIMSAEFYRYEELRNRTRAVLSANPDERLTAIQQADSNNKNSKQPSSAPAENDSEEPVEPGALPTTASTETEPSDPTTDPESPVSTRTPSPTYSASPLPTAASSLSSLHQSSPSPVHLYMVPNSAHLSQSDFGPLFPNLLRYFLKAQDPEKTMELNVRGILAMMRGRGLGVKALESGTLAAEAGGPSVVDRILEPEVVVDRWERVEL